MILASTLAVQVATVDNFFTGNAKVYDGAFDYDLVSSTSFIDWNTPFGFNCAFNLNAVGFYYLFQFGQDITSLTQGFVRAIILPAGEIQIVITPPASGLRIVIQTGGQTVAGFNTFAFSYDGSGLASGVSIYLNGVLDTPASSSGNISGFSLLPYNGANIMSIGGNYKTASSTTQLLNGYIKRLEFLNVEPSVSDLEEATNLTTGGSFRAAGYSGGDFFLEMDFDKVDGEVPVDLAGGRTVTSFGGTQYVDYPSL